MALLSPALKGRMGNTDYYQVLMPAREVVTGVRPASEIDDWASLTIEERMQRDLNLKRVREEIAPYIANSADRFFGSLIVLVWKGTIEFESLTDIKINVPRAYRRAMDAIGFVTIDGGHLIALDGQHRLVAVEQVVKNLITGTESAAVPDDDLSVILIPFESLEKTRRIFNKVNRYAKPTSRGDNIITSEDDLYAIVARWLMSKEHAPLAGKSVSDGPVDWKSNTLADRSTKLTTISVVYESVRLMLDAAGIRPAGQQRPSDDVLADAWEIVNRNWRAILEGMEAYQQALQEPSRIPKLRDAESPYGLLFKPATQQAFLQALMIATRKVPNGKARLSIDEAVDRANRVDWSIASPVWRHITVNENLTVNPYNEAKRRTALLMAYLIAGDLMTPEEVQATSDEYNKARGIDPASTEELVPLPSPVATAS